MGRRGLILIVLDIGTDYFRTGTWSVTRRTRWTEVS